jgi:hypothetical protein
MEGSVPAENPVALPEPGTPSLRDWVRNHDESWIFVAVYLGLAVGLSVFVSLFWLVVVAGLHFVLEIFRQRFYRVGRKSVVLHALWEVKLDVGLVLLALMLVLYIDVVLGILGIQSAARAAAVTRAGARVGTRAAAWERNLRTFLLTVDEMLRVGHAAVLLRRKRKEDRARANLQAAEAAEDPGSEGAPSEAKPAQAEPTADEPEPPAPPADGAEGARAEDASVTPSEGEAPPAAAEDSGSELDALPEPEPVPDAPDRGPRFATPRGRARPVPRPDAWAGKWKLGDRIGVTLVVVGFALIGAAPYVTHHDWHSAGEALFEELRPFPGSDEEPAEGGEAA